MSVSVFSHTPQNAAASLSLTFTLPVGATSGMLLIHIFSLNGNAVALTGLPTNTMTAIPNCNVVTYDASTVTTMYAYMRVLDASDVAGTTTYQYSQGASKDWQGEQIVLNGGTTLRDSQYTNESNVAGGTITPIDLTGLLAGDYVLYGLGARGGGTFTGYTNMAELDQTVTTGTNKRPISVAGQAISSDGAAPTPSATYSLTTNAHGAMSIAIAGSGGGGGGGTTQDPVAVTAGRGLRSRRIKRQSVSGVMWPNNPDEVSVARSAFFGFQGNAWTQTIGPDLLGITDTQIDRVKNTVRTVGPDLLGITDVRALAAAYARPTGPDLLGITDNNRTQAQGHGRVQGPELLGITDARVQVQGHSRTQADAVGITDARVLAAAYVRALVENEGITDVQARASATARTVTEALGITDIAIAAHGWKQIITNTVGLLDAINVAEAHAFSLNDNIAVTDALTRTLQRVLAADPVGLTDQMVQVLAKVRTLADSVTLADVVTQLQKHARTQADLEAISDLVAWAEAGARGPVDSAGITDTIQVQLFKEVPVDDQEYISDAIQTTAAYKRAAAEAVGITDTPQARTDSTRQAADPEGITDTASVQIDARRTPADIEPIQDTVQQAAASKRTQADPVGITDLLAVHQDFAHVRTIVDAVGITDSRSISSSGLKSVSESDGVGISDTLVVRVQSARTLVDTLPTGDVMGSTEGLRRISLDGVAITDALVRELAAARIAADVLGITDTLEVTGGTHTYTRTITDSIGITDTVSSSVLLGILGKLSITHNDTDLSLQDGRTGIVWSSEKSLELSDRSDVQWINRSG